MVKRLAVLWVLLKLADTGLTIMGTSRGLVEQNQVAAWMLGQLGRGGLLLHNLICVVLCLGFCWAILKISRVVGLVALGGLCGFYVFVVIHNLIGVIR